MEHKETTGGGEQQSGVSRYRAAGYRVEVGRTARRAAAVLLQRSGSEDDDAGGTEAVSRLSSESPPAPVGSEAGPAQSSEDQADEHKQLANVYVDPRRHTVSLLLDEGTANMVVYAVRLLVADSEAHAREVRRVQATLPPGSWGATNRHAIASRHERIANRLRALERNYRNVAQ
jgi:hypothetical protein